MQREPKNPELDDLRRLMRSSEAPVPARLRQATLQRLGLRSQPRASFARYALPVAAMAGLALLLWQPAQQQPLDMGRCVPAPRAHKARPAAQAERKAAAQAPAAASREDIAAAQPSEARLSEPAAVGALAPALPRPSASAHDAGPKAPEGSPPQLKLFQNVFKPASGQHFSAQVTLGQQALLHAVILNAHGATVARLAEGAMSAGVHELRWDGRLEDGSAAPSGAYTLLISADKQLAKAHLMVVR